MAWEGSEVPAAPQLGEMIPRCGPGDDNTEENPVDEVEKIERVLAAWKARGLGSGLEAEYAEVAVRALEPTCGAQHPKRPQVVCTTPPHDVAGPTWCRNDAMKLEWDPETGLTVHDDLGPITLSGPPEPRPNEWNHSSAQSGVICGVQHRRSGWVCDREAGHTGNPVGVDCGWHEDSTHRATWTEETSRPDQFSGTSGEVDTAVAAQDKSEAPGLDVELVLAADRRVYRDLIPILENTVETLRFVQDREGRRVNGLICTRAAVCSLNLTSTIKILQGKIGDTA